MIKKCLVSFMAQNHPIILSIIIYILQKRKLSEKYLSQDTWVEHDWSNLESRLDWIQSLDLKSLLPTNICIYIYFFYLKPSSISVALSLITCLPLLHYSSPKPVSCWRVPDHSSQLCSPCPLKSQSIEQWSVSYTCHLRSSLVSYL